MTTRYLLIFVILIPITAICQHQKSDTARRITVQYVSIEDIIQDDADNLDFPKHVKPKFKTTEEWLFQVCANKKPKVKITEFDFNFMESDGGRLTIFVVGVNRYQQRVNNITKHIEHNDFKPKDMYFNLTISDYKNLNKEQLKEKLTTQLKEFTQTEKFKTSYLAEADAIVTSYNGEKIWTR